MAKNVAYMIPPPVVPAIKLSQETSKALLEDKPPPEPILVKAPEKIPVILADGTETEVEKLTEVKPSFRNESYTERFDRLQAWRKRGYADGVVAKHSKIAHKRLDALGFDPIQKMVDLHDEIELELFVLTHNPDGTPKSRFSAQAQAGLIATKQKITSDLLRYGYSRVSESSTVEHRLPPPMKVTLTNKETWSTSSREVESYDEHGNLTDPEDE